VARGAALGVKLGLSPKHARTLASLRTPERIQAFVSDMPTNFERAGETALSVAGVMKAGHAHCLEGAFVAACALWLAGETPWLVEMQAKRDDDHVVALFRRGRCWGAISKTNHVWLRYRDPIYRSVRELMMSYFHEYTRGPKKTLRSHSRLVDMRRVDHRLWVSNPFDCWEAADILASAKRIPIISPAQAKALTERDAMEMRANALLQFTAPDSKTALKY
jgi:hypothetical protein